MKIANQGWNVDTLVDWMKDHCPAVEADNDGQIVLYTDVYEWPDRTLHTEPCENLDNA